MTISTAVTFLLFVLCCFSVEEGWKGILPLHTDLGHVTKLLGSGKIDTDGNYLFETEDASIHAIFSSAPCTEALFGRGDYNVSEGTVIYYVVSLKKIVKFDDLQINRDDYIRDASGDVRNSARYVGKKNGIWIGISIKDGVEYVGSLTYRPGDSDKAKFRCTDKPSKSA